MLYTHLTCHPPPPKNTPVQVELCVTPFHGWGNHSSERLSNLPEQTLLEGPASNPRALLRFPWMGTEWPEAQGLGRGLGAHTLPWATSGLTEGPAGALSLPLQTAGARGPPAEGREGGRRKGRREFSLTEKGKEETSRSHRGKRDNCQGG